MHIPPDRLSPSTLTAVLEAAVTREGSDAPESLLTLEERVDQLRAALRRGDAVLSYDADTETIDVVRVQP